MRRSLVAGAAVVGLAAAFLWIAPGKQAPAGGPNPSGQPAYAWPLPRAIDEAAAYLVRVDDNNGRFTYRAFVDGRHAAAHKYNILRHAGSIYALADYRSQTTAPQALRDADAAMSRSAGYLLAKYVRPLKSQPEIKAVWSDPREEGGSKPTAKLGGAALAIVGLLREMAVTGERDGGRDAGLATVQALGHFILFMQQPNGGFHAKYEEEGGYANDFDSLYYPGEAILALTMLAEVDHDRRWLDAAAHGITRLVESRRGMKGKLPNDHWLMIATDRFLPHYDELTAPSLPKIEMLEHAVALGRTMMDEQAAATRKHPAPETDGAFAGDARTAPSATRLEGLLALEHAIHDDATRTPFRTELRKAIGRGVGFLRRTQITQGAARGGIPLALLSVAVADAGDGTDEEGQEGTGEIRIDYVQHALSAMMRYTQMCTDGGPGCDDAAPSSASQR